MTCTPSASADAVMPPMAVNPESVHSELTSLTCASPPEPPSSPPPSPAPSSPAPVVAAPVVARAGAHAIARDEKQEREPDLFFVPPTFSAYRSSMSERWPTERCAGGDTQDTFQAISPSLVTSRAAPF